MHVCVLMQSLEKDYRWVEPCFEAMLKHWVERSSPPHSWSALVRALESPAIARGDIATSIKVSIIISIVIIVIPYKHKYKYRICHTYEEDMHPYILRYRGYSEA